MAYGGDGVAMRLPAHPASARLARRAVANATAGLPAEASEAAQLAASELVANAFVHAESGADLFVWPRPRGVRVEVVDYGGGVPVGLEAPPDADRGRGLAIVAALAERWGVVLENEWKAVWFEVGDCAPGARRSDGRDAERPAGHARRPGENGAGASAS